MAATTTSFFLGYLDKTTNRDFELKGAASVGDDGRLRLTKRCTFNSVGLVLYAHPIKFADTDGQLTFDTIITFQIDQFNGGPPSDGIAFFIAPAGFNIPADASGGSLAIFDPSSTHSEKIFAVEFATLAKAPRIGINLGSRDSVKSVDFKDYLGKKVTAFISYRERKVTVVAFTDTEKFKVSHDVDLSQFLNQDVQVGVSASTGDFSEDHFLYSWSFDSTLVREKTTFCRIM